MISRTPPALSCSTSLGFYVYHACAVVKAAAVLRIRQMITKMGFKLFWYLCEVPEVLETMWCARRGRGRLCGGLQRCGGLDRGKGDVMEMFQYADYIFPLRLPYLTLPHGSMSTAFPGMR